MTTAPATRTGRLELGVFARVFPAQPAASLAATISDLGFSCVQLNLVALGIPAIPSAGELATVDLKAIGKEFHRQDLEVWGVSASYNMAHPDPAVRAEMTGRTVNLIRRLPEVGARAVTLCTGSRDPDNQWRAHPDNDTAAAWEDMMASFDGLLTAAKDAGVLLAVEPEPGNVITGTDQAVRLLEQLGDRAERIGFILDPANLVAGRDPATRSAVLVDAFDRLGDKAICLHAKDVITWTERLQGTAGLDFTAILDLQAALPHNVPVIIQDSTPEQIGFVRDLLLTAEQARQ